MPDPTESIRRNRAAEINAEPGSREALEAQYGQVSDTSGFTAEFVTGQGFAVLGVNLPTPPNGKA